MSEWRIPSLSETEWAELGKWFPVTHLYRQRVRNALPPETFQGQLGAQLRLERTAEFLGVVADTHFCRRTPAAIHWQWSITTEERLQRALKHFATENNEGTHPHWAVFAYGKLGSLELNLSSDVDLVWIRQTHEDPHSDNATKAIQKGAQRLRELLMDPTEFGFAHRLDFDLRAGGRLGPVISGLDEWIDYFSNYGEAWERLAFVRFRPIWGSQSVLEQAVAAATKFTFRRYLDFSLMESFKELRQKIHEQNWTRSRDGQIDLKLGLGGIRDLELFVHTLQVVYGGKSQAVRLTSTTGALEELTRISAVPAADSQFLEEHYWRLRNYENLVQARDDQQTHILVENQWDGYFSQEQLRQLKIDMEQCTAIVDSFLGPIDQKRRSLPESALDQKAWLAELGVSPEQQESTWRPLLEQEVFSRQKDRDDRWRKVFLYLVLEKAKVIGVDIPSFLPRLAEFVARIRAKATLFHLLVHNDELVGRLVRLMSQSDYLGQILIHRPELLDSFIYQQQPTISENLGWEEMHQIWRDQKLLSELHGGLDLIENKELDRVLRQQTQTADQIATEILHQLKREFRSDLQILALGKWGAGELGVGSDLDFVFVSQRQPEAVDHQVARRFLNRLTQAPALYSVDLRLKPFGGSGVLVTTWEDLTRFLENEAPAWQRQVYLRARPIETPTAEPVVAIFSALADKGLSPTDLSELTRIRSELIQQNERKHPLKFAAGGLTDIELTLQTAILFHRIKITGPSTNDHFNALIQHHPTWKDCGGDLRRLYWQLRLMDQTQRVTKGLSSNKNSSDFDSLMQHSIYLLGRLDPRLCAR